MPGWQELLPDSLLGFYKSFRATSIHLDRLETFHLGVSSKRKTATALRNSTMASIPPGTDIWATPAGKAPEGVTSNLIDPPTRKNVVLITLPILLSIAAIFVALRLYVNIFVTKHKLGWDDCKQTRRKPACFEARLTCLFPSGSRDCTG